MKVKLKEKASVSGSVEINGGFEASYEYIPGKHLSLEVSLLHDGQVLREGSALCASIDAKRISYYLRYAAEKAIAYYLNTETLDPMRDSGMATDIIAVILDETATYLSGTKYFNAAAEKIVEEIKARRS